MGIWLIQQIRLVLSANMTEGLKARTWDTARSGLSIGSGRQDPVAAGSFPPLPSLGILILPDKGRDPNWNLFLKHDERNLDIGIFRPEYTVTFSSGEVGRKVAKRRGEKKKEGEHEDSGRSCTSRVAVKAPPARPRCLTQPQLPSLLWTALTTL